jgi:valyl-tRNA synthetase
VHRDRCVGRRLKIIADEYVKPEFGTGALKITPGHDPNDFEIGRRHGLAEISVIGEDGRMNTQAGEPYAGMSTAEAQAAIVAALRDQGLLAHTEDHQHEVPFSHRSGERIEPLVSLQWFMRMDELAAPAIEAVRRGEVRFHPPRWGRVYLEWMENIRPWCISRQLWWGHQIPVWYRGEERYVGVEDPDGEGWTRDPDVLDTWFSSALWPFATLGWPQDTPELRAFYPTDALSTGPDIIFLWVARMIMMGIEFTGQVPFSDVYVHSIILAPDSRRMSKSLGTGIDPIDLIEGGPRPPVFAAGSTPAGEFPAYGADAVRWGLLAMSSGQDVRFNEDTVAQGQRLANKLWNASRLILTRVDPQTRAAAMPTTIEDRWMLSRLQRARTRLDQAIARCELSRGAFELYDFVYGELCDWYLELVKPRLYEGDGATAATLLHVITETVAMAHSVIPFVTEEIYSYIPGAEGLLAGRIRGAADGDAADPAAEAALERAIGAIQEVRKWRDAAGVAARVTPRARLRAVGYDGTRTHLERLGRLQFVDDDAEQAATIPVPGGVVEILATGDVDPGAAARERAAKRERLQGEIERARSRLSNEGFLAKAPSAVVQAERDKLAELTAELEAL